MFPTQYVILKGFKVRHWLCQVFKKQWNIVYWLTFISFKPNWKKYCCSQKMSIWHFCLGAWIGLKQIFGWWSINKLSTLARLKKTCPWGESQNILLHMDESLKGLYGSTMFHCSTSGEFIFAVVFAEFLGLLTPQSLLQLTHVISKPFQIQGSTHALWHLDIQQSYPIRSMKLYHHIYIYIHTHIYLIWLFFNDRSRQMYQSCCYGYAYGSSQVPRMFCKTN